MPAFMNWNKHEIEPLKQVAAEQRVSDQHNVKGQPSKKGGARNWFPIFLERIKKRESFAERCGNFHVASSIFIRSKR